MLIFILNYWIIPAAVTANVEIKHKLRKKKQLIRCYKLTAKQSESITKELNCNCWFYTSWCENKSLLKTILIDLNLLQQNAKQVTMYT